jgi:hypothetical protein
MKQPARFQQLNLLPLTVEPNVLRQLHPDSRVKLTSLLKLLLKECVTAIEEGNNEGGDDEQDYERSSVT